jgi:phage head maturation protease
MSWAFTERKDSGRTVEEADKITFYVTKVERVFDVSAVDFGANPQTSIYARRRGDLDERAAELDRRKERQAIIDKIYILTNT